MPKCIAPEKRHGYICFPTNKFSYKQTLSFFIESSIRCFEKISFIYLFIYLFNFAKTDELLTFRL